INRRIDIVVMNRRTEQALLRDTGARANSVEDVEAVSDEPLPEPAAQGPAENSPQAQPEEPPPRNLFDAEGALRQLNAPWPSGVLQARQDVPVAVHPARRYRAAGHCCQQGAAGLVQVLAVAEAAVTQERPELDEAFEQVVMADMGEPELADAGRVDQ